MSQAKVDRYKEEKRNRAKIIKKEKRQWMATKAALSAVAIVLVAWIGVSVYNGYTSPDASQANKPTYTVDTAAIDEYMTGLTQE